MLIGTQPRYPPGIVLFYIGIAWTLMAFVVLTVKYPGYLIPGILLKATGIDTAGYIRFVVLSAGMLLLGAVYLLVKEDTTIWLTVPAAIVGIGTIGAGITPRIDFFLAGLFVFLSFIFCGVFAALELRIIAPFRPGELGGLVGAYGGRTLACRREDLDELSPVLSVAIVRILLVIFLLVFCIVLFSGTETSDLLIRTAAGAGWHGFFILFLLLFFPFVVAALGLRTYLRSIWVF